MAVPSKGAIPKLGRFQPTRRRPEVSNLQQRMVNYDEMEHFYEDVDDTQIPEEMEQYDIPKEPSLNNFINQIEQMIKDKNYIEASDIYINYFNYLQSNDISEVFLNSLYNNIWEDAMTQIIQSHNIEKFKLFLRFHIHHNNYEKLDSDELEGLVFGILEMSVEYKNDAVFDYMMVFISDNIDKFGVSFVKELRELSIEWEEKYNKTLENMFQHVTLSKSNIDQMIDDVNRLIEDEDYATAMDNFILYYYDLKNKGSSTDKLDVLYDDLRTDIIIDQSLSGDDFEQFIRIFKFMIEYDQSHRQDYNRPENIEALVSEIINSAIYRKNYQVLNYIIDFIKQNKEAINMKYIKDFVDWARDGEKELVKAFLPLYYEYYSPGKIFVEKYPEITKEAINNALKNKHYDIYDMIIKYGRIGKL